MGTWKVRKLRGLASPVLCEASTRFSHRHRDIEKPCASESSDCPLCVTQVAHWPTAVSQTSLVGGTSTSLDNPEDSLAPIHGASHHGPKFSGTDGGMFDQEQECIANTLPILVETWP